MKQRSAISLAIPIVLRDESSYDAEGRLERFHYDDNDDGNVDQTEYVYEWAYDEPSGQISEQRILDGPIQQTIINSYDDPQRQHGIYTIINPESDARRVKPISR